MSEPIYRVERVLIAEGVRWWLVEIATGNAVFVGRSVTQAVNYGEKRAGVGSVEVPL